MSNAPTEEKVLSVEHFTDRLFAFSITRPASFRFRTGEFIMIGLPKTEDQKRPVMRAYSVASPAWDDKLEFYSIKVEDGPLTSRLQKIETGRHGFARAKACRDLGLGCFAAGQTPLDVLNRNRFRAICVISARP